jgi:hypothetical protein
MNGSLESHLETLRNTKAGWVHRRDAVEALAAMGRAVLETLRAHADDPDPDVRAAVSKAMAQLIGVPEKTREAAASQSSLAELAAACRRAGKRTVTQEGADFRIEVLLENERKQQVLLREVVRRDGARLIQISTQCGAPTEESIRWGLRSNLKLAHCAVALGKDGAGAAVLMLVRNLDARLATPEAVREAVKEMAHYGDWLEKKLTGLDEL